MKYENIDEIIDLGERLAAVGKQARALLNVDALKIQVKVGEDVVDLGGINISGELSSVYKKASKPLVDELLKNYQSFLEAKIKELSEL